jgi:RNA polymerase sigma factor (sigma-70 family)
MRRFLYRLASPRWAGDQDDRHLLERFVATQDPTAFAALVERHGPMVQGVCRRVLHDSHAADDAFQATFLVLVHKAHSLGRPERLGPWLYGVAYRTAVRARDAAARRRTREREMTDMPGDDSTVEVLWRDLRVVLDEELGRLAQKYRVPLVLFYLEGKSTTEVARQLGCPKGTVQSRLARARDQLRNRLVRRGVDLAGGMLAVLLVEKAAPALVPAAVAEGTIKAAVLTAAGQAGGAIPATVTALTKGVLQAMFLSKVKIVAAMVLAVTVASTGTVLYARRALADKPAAKEEAPKDEEKIVGTWAFLSMEKGGQKEQEENVKEAQLIFASDGKLTAKVPKGEKVGTYKLEPAKKPKAITITTETGATIPGIYKLEGDTLTVCLAEEQAKDPPTEFASREGTKIVLIVLKREKK